MEREQETVVGIFHYGGDGNNYVKPIDEKIAMDILIPRGMEYPKADEEARPSEDDRDVHPPNYSGFANTQVRGPQAPTPKRPGRQSPHRVLGEEAQRKKTWDDLEGVVVEVEIVQWPSATQSPRGRVTEILGYEDDFGVDVEMIIRKHHIPHVFPAEVLEEAQEFSPLVPEKEIAQRRDFRQRLKPKDQKNRSKRNEIKKPPNQQPPSGWLFYLARKHVKRRDHSAHSRATPAREWGPGECIVSKEEIIAAIRDCAEKLGRAPSQPELRGLCPSINMGMIRKFLGSYTQALEESGFAGAGCGYEATMDDLFRDWARIARKMGKVPTMTEYDRESRYSVRPLMGRLRSWKQVPRGLHKYAEQSKLDVEFADVLDIITRHYEGNPEAAWISERTTENKAGYAPIMPDRPVYGPPLSPIHLAYGPTNEAGVLFLFAMMAGSLGFVVTRIQSEFPDCEALRQVGEERYQMTRIEFEYESRNFVKHFHDAAKCDLIVCWTHNWPECPLEVIELKGLVKRLG